MLNNTLKGIAVLTFGVTFAGGAEAASFFNNRSLFETQLDSSIVDDYENPGYQIGDKSNGATLDIHTNASMSGILGETSYETTGFQNHNLITTQGSDRNYCAGCNGSYLLDFTSTSIGNSLGIFGVGFDIQSGTDYYGFATYGDGTTEDFALSGSPSFWGLTSDSLISSIHLGLSGGGSTTGGYLQIDNLTIGSKTKIPEPSATIGLLAVGAVAVTSGLSKKQQKKG